MKHCAYCGQALAVDDDFCSKCGTQANPDKNEREVFCRNCGKVIISTAMFCPKCGSSQVGISQYGTSYSAGSGIAMRNSNTENSVFVFASVITSIVCVILMFLSWMRVPELSLFELYNWFERLARIISGSSNNTGVGIFVIVFIILPCIISMIAHIVNIFIILLKKPEEKPYRARLSFSMLVVAVIGLILLTIIANEEFGELRQLYRGYQMSITPFVALLLTAVNRFGFSRAIINRGHRGESSILLALIPYENGVKSLITGQNEQAAQHISDEQLKPGTSSIKFPITGLYQPCYVSHNGVKVIKCNEGDKVVFSCLEPLEVKIKITSYKALYTTVFPNKRYVIQLEYSTLFSSKLIIAEE